MITIDNNYFHDPGQFLCADYFAYVFRVDRDILYVGESSDALRRIEEHVTGIQTNTGLTNALTIANEYQIDLYDAWDLIAFSGESDLIEMQEEELCLLLKNQRSDIRKRFEIHLINTMSPAFNTKDVKGVQDKDLRIRVYRKYKSLHPVHVPNVWG